MGRRNNTHTARDRALEIIRESGGITVNSLAQRLRDEGLYVSGADTFHVGRAAISFARARIRELYRAGKIRSKPNPAIRASEVWFCTD